MNTILQKVEDEIRYLVDYDGECVEGSFDLGDDKANAEYLARFESGELNSYHVIKEAFCKCCKQWGFIDALGAIHAESTEDALSIFKEYYS